MKTYDLIVSLGGSCAEANQLKVRGLRLVSLPFDWIFTKDPAFLGRLAVCFKEDFVNWMKPENLMEVDSGERNPKAAKYQYRDTYTGYCFIHDFLGPKEEYGEKVRNKYRRRIERLYERLHQAKIIALCFDAGFAGSEGPLLAIRDLILDKFGTEKVIDCYLVEFNAPKYEIVYDGALTVYRFNHPKHDYIFGNQASFEFAYMDEFLVSNMFKSEERGKGNRIYLAHTAHGIKCIFFKNKKKRFHVDLGIGSRKYEFSFGGTR